MRVVLEIACFQLSQHTWQPDCLYLKPLAAQQQGQQMQRRMQNRQDRMLRATSTISTMIAILTYTGMDKCVILDQSLGVFAVAGAQKLDTSRSTACV